MSWEVDIIIKIMYEKLIKRPLYEIMIKVSRNQHIGTSITQQ